MKKKWTLIILFCTFIVQASLGQSKTVEAFSKTTPHNNVYLYQSMIRMLNKDKNPDFNMLIRKLDHLKFVYTDSSGTIAMSVFQGLDKGVQSEGFEEIASFDSKDSKCHLYELDTDGDEGTWVVTMFYGGRAGVLEMKGYLDMKYLNALGSLNIDKMANLLNVEDFR